MKITTIIATSIVLSCAVLQAQDASQQQEQEGKSELNQPGQTESDVQAQPDQSDIISEPSGAERPQYSTNNAPEGQLQQEEEPGAIQDDPAGAEKPENKGLDEPSESEDPALDEPAGAESKDVNEPAGAETTQPTPLEADPSGTGTTNQASQIEEPAGAQRGGEQLANALGSIKTGGTVGTDVKMQLKQAISGSVQGSAKVPDEFVDRLANDLSMSFSKVQITQENRTQIANHIHTVINAQPGNQAQIEQALTGIQTILIDSGASRTAARAVGCDLHLIATEVAPGLQLNVPVPK